MTKIEQFEQIQQRIDSLEKELALVREERDALRLETMRQVEMVRNDASITLKFRGRVINAKKTRYGRFKVTEGKKTLVSEYFGSIHDLRVAVACDVL